MGGQQSCDGCVTLSRLLVAMEAERDTAERSARAATQAAAAATENYAGLRAQTGGMAAEITRLHERIRELPHDCADAIEAEIAKVDERQTGFVRDILALAARKVRGVTP